MRFVSVGAAWEARARTSTDGTLAVSDEGDAESQVTGEGGGETRGPTLPRRVGS